MKKSKVTIYVDPAKRNYVIAALKSTISSDFVFYSDDSKLLSWIGEATIEVGNQAEAFALERELQNIPELSDIEIDVEETVLEEELNHRYIDINKTINKGKLQFPHPAWYQHAIRFYDALNFAESEFKAGRGFFDPSTSRSDLALIDTGYSGHPEIVGIDKKQCRNFMPGENASDPLDTLESTRPVPIAWGGHGTSCSGLLMGGKTSIPSENRVERENAYYDDLLEGLLPTNLNVVHFRVSRNIISFSSRMPKAVSHIVNEGDMNVISMSHATLLHRKSVYASTRAAYEKGIILVAAPGSHVFSSKKVYTYPAKYEETIAPAASTIMNHPWKLTHGGPEVDVCAPGFEIYIPWPFKWEGKFGYAYKWSEGSSFAVPIVACAASLWRMHHGERLNLFSPVEQVELFRHIIKRTATPFSGIVEPGLYGTGIINFLAMLQHPLSPLPAATRLHRMNASLEPKTFFQTNKREASILRELNFLRLMQFVNNPSKAIDEMDYYNDSGTTLLKDWIHRKTAKGADTTAALRTILERSNGSAFKTGKTRH